MNSLLKTASLMRRSNTLERMQSSFRVSCWTCLVAKSDSTFVVVSEPHRIGFDCHDFDGIDGLRDEWRDAVILATNGVDVIYRFREADLRMHLPDCSYVASLLDPQIFSSRGRINLETLSRYMYGPPCLRAVR